MCIKAGFTRSVMSGGEDTAPERYTGALSGAVSGAHEAGCRLVWPDSADQQAWSRAWVNSCGAVTHTA